VVTFSDEIRAACQELKRADAVHKIDFALDFFDASINRIAAWAVGSRNLRKALLEAHLEPTKLLVEAEKKGKNHERLALLEECKTLPFSAVWAKLCLDAGVPVSTAWIDEVNSYEENVLSKRT